MNDVYIPEVDDIYFPKTKEYFQEVITSYATKNYRSAIVMLYSVAICDILFKLQELYDMYNDAVAGEILKRIEKLRNNHDNKSKSRWEKELIDDVYKKTKLLSQAEYVNLNHLYDHRNFSAHPALNDNYELFRPSKEITIAHIKNILHGILIKPPIFFKNIVEVLTEDLKIKKNIYIDEYNSLQTYLNNKYFSRMTPPMKLKLFSIMWKFCFCMPGDKQCNENREINRNALQILFSSSKDEILNYMETDNKMFTVVADDMILHELVTFLSHFPELYKKLNDDTKIYIDFFIKKSDTARAISWFKTGNLLTHLQKLKESHNIQYSPKTLDYMVDYYRGNGSLSDLYEYYIWYYGDSSSYDAADERFNKVIRPYLKDFSLGQLVSIIKNSNENCQIYGRRKSYSANTEIATELSRKSNGQFDFSAYEHFNFDQSML